MPNIEYILDVLERLEETETVHVEWDTIEEELRALGFVSETEEEADDE